MNKVLVQWFHLPSMMQMLLDAVLALTGCAVLRFLGAESGDSAASASIYGFMAALVVLGMNARSGFYQYAGCRTATQLAVRAAFPLVTGAGFGFLALWWLPHPEFRGELMTMPALALVAGVVAFVNTGGRTGGRLFQDAVPALRRRVLVLGTGSNALSVQTAAGKLDSAIDVIGFYPVACGEQSAVPHGMITSAGKGLVQTALDFRIDEIVVAVGDRRGGALPLQDLLQCRVMGVRVHDLSSHFEKTHGQIRLEALHAGWLIFGGGFEQGHVRAVMKRLFDIIFSSILLVLSLPVMLIAAIAIALASGFPVFYRQERMGKNGRSFKVIKFRSMRLDAEQDGKPKWATGNDDRVTKVGRFIRTYRIDELPQLVNVLAGEMSLVGPRPERPFFVEQLSRELPFYGVRHSVKPGLTGWAQVNFGYCASVQETAEKLQYDLFYVKNHSLFLDFVVLFRTVGVVLHGHGAH